MHLLSALCDMKSMNNDNSRMNDLRKRIQSTAQCDPGYIQSLVAVTIFVVAVTLAYTANSRSGKNSPILMAGVAALFPEVYLIQATVRMYIVKNYDLY